MANVVEAIYETILDDNIEVSLYGIVAVSYKNYTVGTTKAEEN